MIHFRVWIYTYICSQYPSIEKALKSILIVGHIISYFICKFVNNSWYDTGFLHTFHDLHCFVTINEKFTRLVHNVYTSNHVSNHRESNSIIFYTKIVYHYRCLLTRKKVGFIQRFTQRKLLKSIKKICILYWIRGAYFIKNFIENIGWIEYDFCETIDRDRNETAICHCKFNIYNTFSQLKWKVFRKQVIFNIMTIQLVENFCNFFNIKIKYKYIQNVYTCICTILNTFIMSIHRFALRDRVTLRLRLWKL
jgi:hypothetical protein